MLEKIKALLAEELGVNADEITAETSFKEDLGADSLDLFELVTNLEEEYNNDNCWQSYWLSEEHSYWGIISWKPSFKKMKEAYFLYCI